MTQGIVLVEHDQTIEAGAKYARLEVTIDPGMGLAFEKTLFIARGTAVPWKLVPAGFGFVDKWEAAAPLWRYGVLAQDLGTAEERRKTEEVTLDLRVLLYAHELLFVRKCPAGEALLAAWQEEMRIGNQGSGNQASAEARLAFLRALYLVKPMLCTLPASWLPQPVRSDDRKWLRNSGQIPVATRAEKRQRSLPDDFVILEYAPGKFVRCRKGQEAFMKARLGKLGLTREERRG